VGGWGGGGGESRCGFEGAGGKRCFLFDGIRASGRRRRRHGRRRTDRAARVGENNSDRSAREETGRQQHATHVLLPNRGARSPPASHRIHTPSSTRRGPRERCVFETDTRAFAAPQGPRAQGVAPTAAAAAAAAAKAHTHQPWHSSSHSSNISTQPSSSRSTRALLPRPSRTRPPATAPPPVATPRGRCAHGPSHPPVATCLRCTTRACQVGHACWLGLLESMGPSWLWARARARCTCWRRAQAAAGGGATVGRCLAGVAR
jgi:hypothetical protein